ncbi:hypothetical protein SGL43_00128 [Streptomyces globisporus]|uniref:Uncharacterized protein n=1 Tax=Streptomyces globisporus TaxID=1908 RepID=A0ABM9GP51_STRGL|nr:hypothetical protein SGL43_00128 [Streptomyces globisporus]
MHAAGLYLSLSVSLMKVQGTSDGKRRGQVPGGGRRAKKKGRRSVPVNLVGVAVQPASPFIQLRPALRITVRPDIGIPDDAGTPVFGNGDP